VRVHEVSGLGRGQEPWSLLDCGLAITHSMLSTRKGIVQVTEAANHDHQALIPIPIPST